MAYVQLDRIFEPITEDEDLEALIARSTYRVKTHRISWAKILEHRFVVVLGEAGSGKTRELHAQTTLLNKGGRIEFFVKAEELVTQTLKDAIAPEGSARLDTWKLRDTEAIFFVDAVDEAKLAHRAAAFEKALRRLPHELGAARTRARAIVSCRISDWRPQTDGDTFKLFVERCYSSSVAQGNGRQGASEPLIVTLVRLDPTRIRAFASALGVDDIDAFMNALEERDLDMLSGRPLDVE